RNGSTAPYTALTHKSRLALQRGEDEFSTTPSSNGGLLLRSKALSRYNESLISSTDWQAAAQLAVDKTRQYWGNERAANLEAHHRIVTQLSALYSHAVAMEYDVHQREFLYSDEPHDISTKDLECLQTCFLLTHTDASNSSRQKRSRSDDVADQFHGDSGKSSRFRTTASHCFRCGIPGHLPDACRKETTVAGKPCSQLVTGNTRFKHNLRAADGREYCFKFSSLSSCPAGASAAPAPVAPASAPTDPRQVITPLDALRVQEVLREYDLLNDWSHIISGIQNGFDVGVREHLSHSIIPPNHNSCHLDPKFIDSYILSEEAAGRYSRAFLPQAAPAHGNPAIPRVMANRSPDRLKPIATASKTLGNLRLFPAK
ncbi:hypothetical protein R3P38DRAFT_2525085, partial [Favolaschia claudopus]